MRLIVDKSKDIPYGKDIPCLRPIPQMIASKLTSKSQTTIPQSVRRALDLQPGDVLEYEITNGQVLITKAQNSNKTDDPFRTFDEWSSAADEQAYAGL
jgi:antitoxin PrlF